MDAKTRLEQALTTAVAYGAAAETPPGLAAAIRYGVFPGGARVRPRLCLAVAQACGDGDSEAAAAAAASIELLHCASLIHDDLPCFDDAPLRRGKLSVHKAFGERLAVLAGDALIVLAFETLARGLASQPERLARLLLIVGRAVGTPSGIVAGQAWECEPRVILDKYERAKTGALFVGATEAGAAAAGADPEAWGRLGERIGEAFQVADDLHDATGNADELGKPVGRDAVLDRPSAARELGIDGAVRRLKHLLAEAMDSIPPCPGVEQMRATILAESQRFVPKELSRLAA